MEKRQILPNNISKAMAKILFAYNLVTHDNKQASRLTVKRIYEEKIQMYKERRLLPFHYIDLPLL